MHRILATSLPLLAGTLVLGCAGPAEEPVAAPPSATKEASSEGERLLSTYTTVRLTTDTSVLTESEKQMIPLLIEAARAMDDVFWKESFGNKKALLESIEDPALRRYAEINYGPWDRLRDNESFVEGFGPKPLGAGFYPQNLTEADLDAAVAAATEEQAAALKSLYTRVKRNEKGELVAVPYHEEFAAQHQLAAEKLRAAAELAEDAGLKRYLELRAEALLTDDYRASDLAWMDMKTNGIDVVIGPIETYEDKLKGWKAAHEGYVLVKDREWSDRLSRYAALLPDLQRGLPVPDAYKKETPGTDSDLNAYDVVYYAGDCNAGSKTIAINLPNDETVQLEKGTRRLQLKNAMRAKFDEILVPIAGVLIDEAQRGDVTFDAFFENTMFHEVAHGLGIKNTIDGGGTVREALGANASALEEGKADVLGLYMVASLHDQGELGGDHVLARNHATFLASIFRSIRFGSATAHGVANLIRFNFFQEMGAFSRDEATGTYRVEPEALGAAVDALSERILTLQGDGDAQAVADFVANYGVEGEQLRADLDRLEEAGIPVDVVFEQGIDVLGLGG